jgi:HTH-like domain
MRFRLIADTGRSGRACHVRGAECVAVGLLRVRSRPDSPRRIANRALLVDIRRVHAQHRERYGAPRIYAQLRAEGQTVSRKRVERVMRQHGIRARTPRRYRVYTTDSKHGLSVAANRLEQNFVAHRPDQVWLATLRPCSLWQSNGAPGSGPHPSRGKVRVPLSPGGDQLLQVIADVARAQAPVDEVFVRLSHGKVTATIPLRQLFSDPGEDIYFEPSDVLTPHPYTAELQGLWSDRS